VLGPTSQRDRETPTTILARSAPAASTGAAFKKIRERDNRRLLLLDESTVKTEM
jgi:hypothetical protein